MTEDISKLLKELTIEIHKIEEVEQREEALQRLQDIALTYAGDDRVISSLELAATLKNRPKQRCVLSGISGLDSILGGFREKQVVAICAPTKSGKTAFCVDLTLRMTAEHPLWLPFEESAEELVQKFLDREETPPLFYTPQSIPNQQLRWIEHKIIEAKAKHNSKLVFIDHLHFIVPLGSDRIDLRIGETMRHLKRLAVKWGVIIFIIAHLSKTKVDVAPTLEDIRDSSFVAQESDTVLMLWRQTIKDGNEIIITDNVNVSVQANRRTGKTGNVKMIYEHGRFIEKDWKHAKTAADKSLDEYFD